VRKTPLSKEEKEKAEKIVEELKLSPSNGNVTFHFVNGKIANIETRIVLR
jgi:uncharacterized protein YaiL (DUF2058 family)